jgi:hypothetical protein
MPTICFSDDFTSKQKLMLTRTFRQNCKDLGIADYDATIQVRKFTKAPEFKAAILHMGENSFGVLLNTRNDARDSILSLGHEMVHVKQYRNGELRDDHKRGGAYWNDQYIPAVYCRSEQFYNSLPWEIEAHGIQQTLYESAMMDLAEKMGVKIDF